MPKSAWQSYFFAVRFQKAHGKGNLCRAIFQKRTAKIFIKSKCY
jgi:hypothetical protein